MTYYLYLGSIILLDLFATLSARYSSNFGDWRFAILSIILLSAAGLLLMRILKYGVTAVINAIWIGLGTTLSAICSFFLFDEALSTVQISGMLIMVAGIIILESAKKESS